MSTAPEQVASAAPLSPAASGDPQLLRFATAGSVDDGKSTLIGRLHYDAKSLHADALEAVMAEIAATRVTERGETRADDRVSEAAMEDRKKEGYF